MTLTTQKVTPTITGLQQPDDPHYTKGDTHHYGPAANRWPSLHKRWHPPLWACSNPMTLTTQKVTPTITGLQQPDDPHYTKGDTHHYGPAANLHVFHLRRASVALGYEAFESRLGQPLTANTTVHSSTAQVLGLHIHISHGRFPPHLSNSLFLSCPTVWCYIKCVYQIKISVN